MKMTYALADWIVGVMKIAAWWLLKMMIVLEAYARALLPYDMVIL